MAEASVHVVDDDHRIRRSIARLLRSTGFSVETYSTAQDFLARKPVRGPGCVILDLSMPGMSGLELQQIVNQSEQSLSIIFLSGTGDVASSVRAMKAGAVDFLTKPVNEDELLAAAKAAFIRTQGAHTAKAAINCEWTTFNTLTAREREVCILVSQGLLNKQIAGVLGIGEKTVKAHRSVVMRKLAIGSAAELVKMVERLRQAGRLTLLPARQV